MGNYKPLSDKQVAEISTEYLNERLDKVSPQENPSMVLVGGQAGAGKSAAAMQVRQELKEKGGYIHVDADRMREAIDIGNNKVDSKETQADAGRLVQEVRKQAIDQKLNILEEGTFRDSEGAATFIQDKKDKGYNVELVAVATSKDESMLGVYHRHEMQHAAKANNPRFVTQTYHDEAFEGFRNTLKSNEQNLDRVRVVNRSMEVLHDTQSKNNASESAYDALTQGQKLTPEKLKNVASGYEVVQAAAEERGAPADYMKDLTANANKATQMHLTVGVVDQHAKGEGLTEQQRALVAQRTIENMEKNPDLAKGLPNIQVKEERTIETDKSNDQER